MSKTILITGANGLLGQKLVKQLLPHSNEYKIIATSKGKCRLSNQDGFTYRELDITQKKAVLELMKEYSPDVVINTAAVTNVDACEDQKELCWDINVNAVEYFIEACKNTNSHFIHLSTDFIFDGESGPYDETAIANPLSYYGKSKLASEELLINSDIKWSIVRTVLVYGVAEEMSRSNIVLWAIKALSEQQTISVIDDQFRTPTLAEDLADGCIKIALLGKEGIYNISGKDFMSVYELVERTANFFNFSMGNVSRINSTTLNQKAKRPPVTGFVIDKAINDLGYDPVSFEEGLQIVDIQIDSND